jgi:RNA polymerase sigma factor (sigma-70 family)
VQTRIAVIARQDSLKNYTKIQRPLRAYLRAATGDLHEGEDLSQQLWQVWCKKLDEFEDAQSFKAFGVARLQVLKWKQRNAGSKEVLSEDMLGKQEETGQDQVARINARHAFLLDCIAELAETTGKALGLKYGERQRSREIGRQVNRSAETVDRMVSRARGARAVLRGSQSEGSTMKNLIHAYLEGDVSPEDLATLDQALGEAGHHHAHGRYRVQRRSQHRRRPRPGARMGPLVGATLLVASRLSQKKSAFSSLVTAT